MSSLEEQEQEMLHLCLTGFTLRKPVKTQAEVTGGKSKNLTFIKQPGTIEKTHAE